MREHTMVDGYQHQTMLQAQQPAHVAYVTRDIMHCHMTHVNARHMAPHQPTVQLVYKRSCFECTTLGATNHAQSMQHTKTNLSQPEHTTMHHAMLQHTALPMLASASCSVAAQATRTSKHY